MQFLNWLFWILLGALLLSVWGGLTWWLCTLVLGSSTTAKVVSGLASVVSAPVMTILTFAALSLFLRPKL